MTAGTTTGATLPTDTSMPGALSKTTLDTIRDRFALDELTGDDGGPYRLLTSPMTPDPVGCCRVFAGGPVASMVYIGMVVPMIQLDSHMIFAFTRPDSFVPHFTLDSVQARGPDDEPDAYFAFHLDCIPRADLGANLAYLDHCMHPLTPIYEAGAAIDGLEAAHIGPRQYALMSEWMLAFRASDSAFRSVAGVVGQYVEHWCRLVDEGLPESVLGGIGGLPAAERDRRNRDAVFNPDVDRVWAQVERLIGAESGAELREILKRQEW